MFPWKATEKSNEKVPTFCIILSTFSQVFNFSFFHLNTFALNLVGCCRKSMATFPGICKCFIIWNWSNRWLSMQKKQNNMPNFGILQLFDSHKIIWRFYGLYWYFFYWKEPILHCACLSLHRFEKKHWIFLAILKMVFLGVCHSDITRMHDLRERYNATLPFDNIYSVNVAWAVSCSQKCP